MSFSIRRRRLSRRRWLRGAMGATLALPLLEFFHDEAAAQLAPPRLLVYFTPNGRRPEWWVPTVSAGGNLVFPNQARALQPFAGRALAIDGLKNTAAMNSPGAAHAMGTGTLMTGVQVVGNAELRRPRNGITLDQLLVRETGVDSRFSSLQWGGGEPGACDVGGSSCAYTQSISWTAPGQHLVPTINPSVAFQRLFTTSVDGLEGPAANARRTTRRSVLDFVRADARRFEGSVGTADRAHLDQYFTALREVERSFEMMPLECDPGQPILPRLSYAERVEAFHRLIRLAFLCGQTRIISFMLEFGLSQRSHAFLDAPGNHHGLSHTDGHPRLERIETWYAEQLANLLQLLDETPLPGGGSLLDDTLVLAIASMGEGAVHDHTRNAPVLFGGQRVVRTTGQKLHYPVGREAELADLHVTLMRAFGVEGNHGNNGAAFGDYGVGNLSDVLA